jgi:hypothetical protein
MNMLPRKGDIIVLTAEEGGAKLRIKIDCEKGICRHFHVRDKKGERYSLFLSLSGDYELVPLLEDGCDAR